MSDNEGEMTSITYCIRNFQLIQQCLSTHGPVMQMRISQLFKFVVNQLSFKLVCLFSFFFFPPYLVGRNARLLLHGEPTSVLVGIRHELNTRLHTKDKKNTHIAP
jgi:hypothetical protein